MGWHPAHFPDKTVKAAKNYCRGVGSGKHPWCYTTDPKTRTESCQFPVCKGLDNCYFSEVATYTGTVSKSTSGKKCLRWDSAAVKGKCKYCKYPQNYPDASIADASNYCRALFSPRNKTLGHKPWCYVAENKPEYCDVPQCPEKCSNILENTYGSTSVRSERISNGKRNTFDTAEECLALCQKTPGCNRWFYVSTAYKVKKHHKICIMSTTFRSLQKLTGIMSGSKLARSKG